MNTDSTPTNQFRKKPVVIEAVQYKEYGKLVKGMCNSRSCYTEGNNRPHVHTIHNNQIVLLEVGDWIIPEPDGEHYYPSKPDIFEKTYEPVTGADTTPLSKEEIEKAAKDYFPIDFSEQASDLLIEQQMKTNDASRNKQDGFIEGAKWYAQQLHQSKSDAVQLLRELCDLKQYKERNGKDVYYKIYQPELWKKANEFLYSLELLKQMDKNINEEAERNTNKYKGGIDLPAGGDRFDA